MSNPDNSDGVVRQLVRGREALAEFRYIFGLRARSLKDVERLKQWAVDGDEDLAAAAGCGRYFDVKICRVARPSVCLTLGLIAFVIALYVSTFASVGLATRSEVLVSVKDTSQWFWLSTEQAVHTDPLRWYRNVLNEVVPERYIREDCAAYQAARGTSTKEELGLICAGLLHPQLDTFVEKSLKEQREYLAGLSALLGWLLFLTISSLWSIQSANNLLRRLPSYDHPRPTPPLSIRFCAYWAKFGQSISSISRVLRARFSSRF